MILRSRLVLPVCSPPIPDGAVAILGDRITAVGPWHEVRASTPGDVVDLGAAILLPGLINAHCHLDYTEMAGMLPPRRSFSDWIKSIVTLKATWSDADFARSWRRGAEMLLRSGVTTVVDAEAVPNMVPLVLPHTPLRVVSCHEIISIKRSGPALLAEAEARVAGWPNERKGLSPHAPYTTTSELLRDAARLACEREWLLTTHIAESSEEFEMFTGRRGAMHDWLEPQRRMEDCATRTPVQHVDAAGALDHMLVVHANYVTPEDIALLVRRQAAVVHCPRSHDYFEHQHFPYDTMRKAGVRICLGTDSLATVHRHSRDGLELTLFAEMRAFAGANPGVSPEEIVRMVTSDAARAIHAPDLGVLRRGAMADIITIPATDRDPYEAVLQYRGPVTAAMIGGCWATSPAHD